LRRSSRTKIEGITQPPLLLLAFGDEFGTEGLHGGIHLRLQL
jgi:hypothetical protein